MNIPVLKILLNNGDEYIIDKDLISFNCTENLKNANLDATTGLIVQSASVSFYDRKRLFYGLLISNSRDIFYHAIMYVYLNSTTNTPMDRYTIETVKLDNSTGSIVELECTDPSNVFNLFDISSLPVLDRTVEDLFNVIFAQVNIPWDYLDKETEKRCKSIKVLNSYFKSGTTVKDAIDRVCQLALLNIFYRNGIFVVGRCV